LPVRGQLAVRVSLASGWLTESLEVSHDELQRTQGIGYHKWLFWSIPVSTRILLEMTKRERIMPMTIHSCKWSVLAVGFLAGICLVASPAKADNTAEATYKAKCAACHGPDGKGETSMGKTMKSGDFASEAVQKMSDTDLSDAISKGKGKMPAYKTLTSDQVKGLVAYIRSFAKKP
jgi:cytochrome c553